MRSWWSRASRESIFSLFLTLNELKSNARGYDIVVVGSGPAGLTVAREFLDVGASVLLVESGPRWTRGAAGLNVVDSVGLSFPGATAGRTRTFGGTGQSWSGQCLPLDAVDFDERSWVRHSGWPFAEPDLLPYYRRAEELFRVEGCTYDAGVLARAGTPAADIDSSVFRHRNTVYSPRHKLGSALRRTFRRSSAMHVLTGATASKVIVSTDGTEATGIEVLERRGLRTTIGAPIVVVACGAIENARLLLLSSHHGIGNDHDQVGRYFQDHPFCSAAEVIAGAEEVLGTYRAIFDGGIRHRAKTALAPEFQRSEQVLAATIDLDFQYSETSAVGALKRLHHAVSRREVGLLSAADFSRVLRDPVPVMRLATRRLRGVGVEGEVPERVFLRVQTEQAPNPESRVTLGPARDALGMPRARVDWQIGRSEWKTTRVAVDAIARQWGDRGLARVVPMPWLSSYEKYRCRILDSYHHSGTTRMSRTPVDGVVDPDCQVHGVTGLFLAGGSVFPTSGYANPTLTIVAMSIRLADHLKGTESWSMPKRAKSNDMSGEPR
jgi:choline dehydrogenase-like flavoprotein